MALNDGDDMPSANVAMVTDNEVDNKLPTYEECYETKLTSHQRVFPYTVTQLQQESPPPSYKKCCNMNVQTYQQCCKKADIEGRGIPCIEGRGIPCSEGKGIPGSDTEMKLSPIPTYKECCVQDKRDDEIYVLFEYDHINDVTLQLCNTSSLRHNTMTTTMSEKHDNERRIVHFCVYNAKILASLFWLFITILILILINSLTFYSS